jgi:hypothetical protein
MSGIELSTMIAAGRRVAAIRRPSGPEPAVAVA